MTVLAFANSNCSSSPAPDRRSRRLARLRQWDTAFRWLTGASAATVLALLAGVILVLIVGAAPALRAFGFEFLFDSSWNPVTERFGALAPIYGTLVVSLIALAIAVPVGLGIAVFLNELCPRRLRRPDRHRHRIARRHPQHHLRHLGPVRAGAVPAIDRAAGADRYVRGTCPYSTRCLPGRLTGSAS